MFAGLPSRWMRLAACVTAIVCSAALPARADDRLPKVRSESAAVLDARTGAEVYGKDADEVRAIASTT